MTIRKAIGICTIVLGLSIIGCSPKGNVSEDPEINLHTYSENKEIKVDKDAEYILEHVAASYEGKIKIIRENGSCRIAAEEGYVPDPKVWERVKQKANTHKDNRITKKEAVNLYYEVSDGYCYTITV